MQHAFKVVQVNIRLEPPDAPSGQPKVKFDPPGPHRLRRFNQDAIEWRCLESPFLLGIRSKEPGAAAVGKPAAGYEGECFVFKERAVAGGKGVWVRARVKEDACPGSYQYSVAVFAGGDFRTTQSDIIVEDEPPRPVPKPKD